MNLFGKHIIIQACLYSVQFTRLPSNESLWLSRTILGYVHPLVLVSKADVPENSFMHTVRDWNALAVNLIDQIAQLTLSP